MDISSLFSGIFQVWGSKIQKDGMIESAQINADSNLKINSKTISLVDQQNYLFAGLHYFVCHQRDEKADSIFNIFYKFDDNLEISKKIINTIKIIKNIYRTNTQDFYYQDLSFDKIMYKKIYEKYKNKTLINNINDPDLYQEISKRFSQTSNIDRDTYQNNIKISLNELFLFNYFEKICSKIKKPNTHLDISNVELKLINSLHKNHYFITYMDFDKLRLNNFCNLVLSCCDQENKPNKEFKFYSNLFIKTLSFIGDKIDFHKENALIPQIFLKQQVSTFLLKEINNYVQLTSNDAEKEKLLTFKTNLIIFLVKNKSFMDKGGWFFEELFKCLKKHHIEKLLTIKNSNGEINKNIIYLLAFNENTDFVHHNFQNITTIVEQAEKLRENYNHQQKQFFENHKKTNNKKHNISLK